MYLSDYLADGIESGYEDFMGSCPHEGTRAFVEAAAAAYRDKIGEAGDVVAMYVSPYKDGRTRNGAHGKIVLLSSAANDYEAMVGFKPVMDAIESSYGQVPIDIFLDGDYEDSHITGSHVLPKIIERAVQV